LGKSDFACNLTSAMVEFKPIAKYPTEAKIGLHKKQASRNFHYVDNLRIHNVDKRPRCGQSAQCKFRAKRKKSCSYCGQMSTLWNTPPSGGGVACVHAKNAENSGVFQAPAGCSMSWASGVFHIRGAPCVGGRPAWGVCPAWGVGGCALRGPVGVRPCLVVNRRLECILVDAVRCPGCRPFDAIERHLLYLPHLLVEV